MNLSYRNKPEFSAGIFVRNDIHSEKSIRSPEFRKVKNIKYLKTHILAGPANGHELAENGQTDTANPAARDELVVAHTRGSIVHVLNYSSIFQTRLNEII